MTNLFANKELKNKKKLVTKIKRDSRAWEREQDSRAREALNSFMATVRPIAEAEAHKLKQDRAIDIDKKKRLLSTAIRTSQQFTDFYNVYLQHDDATSSIGNGIIYKIRDYLLGVKKNKLSMEEVKTFILNKVKQSYIAQVSQDNIIHQVYPEEVLKFLPANLTVQVDDNDVVKEIRELKGNQTKNIAYKIQQLKTLVEAKPQIESKLRTALHSNIDFDKVGATILTIIRDTGIRPSKNISELRPEEISSTYGQTFGAISLQTNHVIFFGSPNHPTSAKLDFIGKKGTENKVDFTPTDDIGREALKVFYDCFNQAKVKEQQTGKPQQIFTVNGSGYTKSNLRTFMNKLGFGNIDPTDFRKLKATESFFDELKKSTQTLYQELLGIRDDQAASLKDEIIKKIMAAIEDALEHSQADVNHKQSKTTIEYYINPKVLMSFLSDGGVDRSLKDILTQDVVFRFDPLEFIRKAREYAKANGQIVSPETNPITVMPSSPALKRNTPQLINNTQNNRIDIPKITPPSITELSDNNTKDTREPISQSSVRNIVIPEPPPLPVSSVDKRKLNFALWRSGNIPQIKNYLENCKNKLTKNIALSTEEAQYLNELTNFLYISELKQILPTLKNPKNIAAIQKLIGKLESDQPLSIVDENNFYIILNSVKKVNF